MKALRKPAAEDQHCQSGKRVCALRRSGRSQTGTSKQHSDADFARAQKGHEDHAGIACPGPSHAANGSRESFHRRSAEGDSGPQSSTWALDGHSGEEYSLGRSEIEHPDLLWNDLRQKSQGE